MATLPTLPGYQPPDTGSMGLQPLAPQPTTTLIQPEPSQQQAPQPGGGSPTVIQPSLFDATKPGAVRPMNGGMTLPDPRAIPIEQTDIGKLYGRDARHQAIADGTASAPPLSTAGDGDLVDGWEEFGNTHLTDIMARYGLPAEAAKAMCGPIAMAGLLRAYGVNTDPGALAADGLKQKLWSQSLGMTMGDGTAVTRLLNQQGGKSGLTFENVPVGPDSIAHIQQLAESGTPVVLNTANHYLLLQDYDESTGRFYVGATGSNALDGGSDWMSLDEIARHPGAGAVESFIVPNSQPGPTHAGGRNVAGQPGDVPLVVAPDTSSRAATVASIAPLARYWEQRTGIPASVLIAINIHEGGSGVMAAPFGIKGPSPQGTASNQATFEIYGGQRQDITDSFASYPSLNAAYDHFFQFVQGPRYKGSWDALQSGETDWLGFLNGLVNAGYATDKQWGQHIANFARDSIQPLLSQSGV